MGNVIFSQTTDAEPVTLAEAKKHLNIEHDRDNDLITRQINAARRWLENERAMQLVDTTRDMTLRCFPTCNELIRLPYPPLQSVTHVKYIATDGTLTTLTADEDYLVSTDGPIPFIEPAYSKFWPNVRDQHNAVQIRYVCGPASAAAVDDAGKCAMLLLIGILHKHREGIVTGTIVAELRAMESLAGVEGVGYLL